MSPPTQHVNTGFLLSNKKKKQPFWKHLIEEILLLATFTCISPFEAIKTLYSDCAVHAGIYSVKVKWKTWAWSDIFARTYFLKVSRAKIKPLTLPCLNFVSIVGIDMH